MTKPTGAYFLDCVVTTKASTQSLIPAGRHPIFESPTQGGGVIIVWPGVQIDIDYSEWSRLVEAGLVTD